MLDAYTVLGVARKATDEEIHAAYKKRARALHPDHGGDLAAMSELNEAYARIKTPELRKKYDSSHSFTSTMATWSAAMGKSTVARDFGKKPEHVDSRMKNGTDVPVSVSVDMGTFLTGTNLMTVEYKVFNECLECSGTGGASLTECPDCLGNGKIRKLSPTNVDSISTCARCHGSGRVPVGECSVCHGSGYTEKTTRYSFRYKKCTLEMKVPGKGNGGMYGGANGNLLLQFKVVPTEKLSFDGEKFIYTDTVPVESFILGTYVEMDYPGPLQMVEVPPGDKYRHVAILENFANTGYQCVANLTPSTETNPEKVAPFMEEMRDSRKDIVSGQENN